MTYYSMNAHAREAAVLLDEYRYGDTAEKLQKLATYHRQGLLTNEEYVQETLIIAYKAGE